MAVEVITIKGGYVDGVGYAAQLVSLNDYEKVRDALQALLEVQPMESPIFRHMDWEDAVEQAKQALE